MLWYTSFASSILWKFHISKSRSDIRLHDEYLSDIDHWLYFKSHIISHIRYMHIDISIEMIIFIVVHSLFRQIVEYYDHVHWQSFIDTKSKKSNDNDRHRYNHFILIAISVGRLQEIWIWKNNWSANLYRIVFIVLVHDTYSPKHHDYFDRFCLILSSPNDSL